MTNVFSENIRVPILTGVLFLFSTGTKAVEFTHSNAKTCPTNCSASNCSELVQTGNPAETRLLLLAAIILMLAVFLSHKYKSKLFIAGGSALSMLFVALLFINPFVPKVSSQECQVIVAPTVGLISDTAREEEFKATDSDFEPVSSGDFANKNTGKQKQVPPEASTDEFSKAGSDFAPTGGEPGSTTGELARNKSSLVKEQSSAALSDQTGAKTPDYRLLYQLSVLFLLLITISYLIKYESFRKTRGLFLLASVAYLGFYKGACPCMILSFQNTILTLLGQPVEWISMVWFLGLVPLTYFFGKIWCGWLCHLGGLQDFLFQSPKLHILKTNNAQNILRHIRIGLLAVLIVQILITKTNMYIHYDPFKVAFNLFSTNTTGYALLVLLLAASVLIYRPFCRAVCPVGLILGWITLIPGARRLSKNESCVDCITCSKSCRSKVMIYERQKSILNIQDCILCGDCMGSCKKNSLYLVNLKK